MHTISTIKVNIDDNTNTINIKIYVFNDTTGINFKLKFFTDTHADSIIIPIFIKINTIIISYIDFIDKE